MRKLSVCVVSLLWFHPYVHATCGCMLLPFPHQTTRVSLTSAAIVCVPAAAGGERAAGQPAAVPPRAAPAQPQRVVPRRRGSRLVEQSHAEAAAHRLANHQTQVLSINYTIVAK